MKKLVSVLLLCASAIIFAAATEIDSFRVNNEIVSVGDSFRTLMEKAGWPTSQYSYDIDTGGKTSVTVTDFVYSIGNEIYTVTVKEGRVTRIIWERD